MVRVVYIVYCIYDWDHKASLFCVFMGGGTKGVSEYEREGGFMGRWDGERCGVGWWVHWVFGGWVWAQQC